MNAFKTFATVKDGLEELCKISSSICALLSSTAGDEDDENDYAPSTWEELVSFLSTAIVNNPPSIFDEHYPDSLAFSVNAREVGYKFPGQLSFGIRVFLTDDGSVEYGFRISISRQSNALARRSSIMKKADELGWKLVDSPEDQRSKKA